MIIPFFLLYGAAGAILVGIGFYALAVMQHVYRKIIAWNVLGSGVFLILGSIGKRNAIDGVSDPLPQAIVITGIVVSVSATALGLSIARRLYQLNGESDLEPGERREPSSPGGKE